MRAKSRSKLRLAVLRSLRKQGYHVINGAIITPESRSKDAIRALHTIAMQHKLEAARPRLSRYEDRLLRFIANGEEVDPLCVSPRLVQVQAGTENELLFRWATLHWSIPVSSGYGRRLRFLVFDENNGKLIGLFGLCDPVYSMSDRDQWIGWDAEAKKRNLYHVMEAFVLGAVPPYSQLLCGKLVALLMLSNEVRDAFRRRYASVPSVISGRVRPPYLALITTTSALGRSSIYNRIRMSGVTYWRSVGYTQGSGEFHFSNGIYADIRAYAERYCEPTSKQATWGDGFRNKREIVKKCLTKFGLSTALIYHGVKREIFAACLGKNTQRFLCGQITRPGLHDWPADQLAAAFIDRWLLPRAVRMPDYRTFVKDAYRLWH
ncbi:MAG: Druantia anti-phage system protein DruA [Phycisphaerae bacterium]